MISTNLISEETERCLLGAILLKPEVLSEVDHLESGNFGLFTHRAVFNTIKRLAETGKPIDAVSVAGQLISAPDRDRIGDIEEVSLLLEICMEAVPHAEHARYYADQVVEASSRRRIAQIGSELVNAVEGGAAIHTLNDRLETLTALAVTTQTSDTWLQTRCFADVEARAVEWLWPQLIPLGKLTLLCGDPGLGKSFVTCDIAARVSRGDSWPTSELPDEPPVSGSVLFLACEDDAEDTIRPRLDAAGADVARIHIIDSVAVRKKERGFSLDGDVPLLRELISQHGDVRLLVIDPISAYCGKADTHRNSEVRSLLAPLTDLATEHRLAIVGINHLTKGAGKAIYRGTGSIAFNAAARAVLNFYRAPDDEDRRLIVPTKMNLAPESNAFAYVIEDGAVQWEEEPVDVTADELESLDRTFSEKKGSVREKAVDFLRITLAGGPMASAELFEAAEAMGIRKRTLQRALKDSECVKRKQGMTGGWIWSWPGESPISF